MEKKKCPDHLRGRTHKLPCFVTVFPPGPNFRPVSRCLASSSSCGVFSIPSYLNVPGHQIGIRGPMPKIFPSSISTWFLISDNCSGLCSLDSGHWREREDFWGVIIVFTNPQIPLAAYVPGKINSSPTKSELIFSPLSFISSGHHSLSLFLWIQEW